MSFRLSWKLISASLVASEHVFYSCEKNTLLTSVYSCNACMPISRPIPLRLYPPNGTSSSLLSLLHNNRQIHPRMHTTIQMIGPIHIKWSDCL